MTYEQFSENIFLTYDTCTVAQVEIISKEHTTFTYYIIVRLSKVNEYQTLFGFPIKTNKMKCSYCRFACTHYLKNKRTAACITKLYMN